MKVTKKRLLKMKKKNDESEEADEFVNEEEIEKEIEQVVEGGLTKISMKTILSRIMKKKRMMNFSEP